MLLPLTEDTFKTLQKSLQNMSNNNISFQNITNLQEQELLWKELFILRG